MFQIWSADQACSYKSKDFGLGLAIAQSLVQSHGGLLTVTSQLGVGSCFTVRLGMLKRQKLQPSNAGRE